jgi:hypothetical protein
MVSQLVGWFRKYSIDSKAWGDCGSHQVNGQVSDATMGLRSKFFDACEMPSR